jgi:hypothetical protein
LNPFPPTSTNTPTPTGFSWGFLLPESPGMAAFPIFPLERHPSNNPAFGATPPRNSFSVLCFSLERSRDISLIFTAFEASGCNHQLVVDKEQRIEKLDLS